MEPQITIEQQIQLNTWAAQRDTILGEIAVLKREEEALILSNQNAGEAFTDVQVRTNIAIGRLQELDASHFKLSGMLTQEIANLMAQKSGLESSIEGKKTENESLDREKNLLVEMISTLKSTSDDIFAKFASMEDIVGRVALVSQQNTADMNALLSNFKNSIDKMLGVNKENVKLTKIILDKLPKYIFELQKPIPVRSRSIEPIMIPANDPTPLES